MTEMNRRNKTRRNRNKAEGGRRRKTHHRRATHKRRATHRRRR